MSVARTLTAAAWLLSVVLYCGCSGGGSKPSTQSSPTTPAQTDTARTDTAPAAVVATASDQDNSDDLVAQIKQLQDQRLQPPRSRQDLVALTRHFAEIVDLSAKALERQLDPADRDQVIEAAFHALGTLVQLNFQTDGSENDPSINQRLFGMSKELATKVPNDPRVHQLLYMIGDSALSNSQNDMALEVLTYLSQLDSQGQFGKLAAGKLRLLETMGKPPEIAGPTLEGSEIDIAQFKGKVVLVDFWATWCRPCVAELPNVREVYEKHHDEGFEVIAVSFDRTKEDLVSFVEDRKLPWPQIFFDEEEKRFSLGEKYGITGIPATFLIDRQGNLQKVDVRGEELETAVAEMLKEPKPPLAN